MCLQYFGLWFLLATVPVFCFLMSDYWLSKDFDEMENPCLFNFSTFMSKQRFGAITHNLHFTSKTLPDYTDWIWEVCMIGAWNKHMTSVFATSWIHCLEKACPFRTECLYSQAGSSVLGSHLLLATSTTLFVV